MLVLSRMQDESLMFGDEDTALVPLTVAEMRFLLSLREVAAHGSLAEKLDRAEDLGPGPIEVLVVDIRYLAEDRKVRLGTEAPIYIPVHRKEVYQKVQRERAAQVKPESGGAVAPAPLVLGGVPNARQG